MLSEDPVFLIGMVCLVLVVVAFCVAVAREPVDCDYENEWRRRHGIPPKNCEGGDRHAE